MFQAAFLFMLLIQSKWEFGVKVPLNPAPILPAVLLAPCLSSASLSLAESCHPETRQWTSTRSRVSPKLVREELSCREPPHAERSVQLQVEALQ